MIQISGSLEVDLLPCAKKLLKLSELTVDQFILVNYNVREENEVGEWYRAKVTEVESRKNHLVCNLFLGGRDNEYQLTVKINFLTEIFELERVVPVDERS